jgi:methionine-rich copper-binding protein CopC
MLPIRRALSGPLLALALLATGRALAQDASPMRVIEVSPATRTVLDGNRQEFFVRFSAPVDHHASRLAILQDGREVRSLQPRLNASPDTLHAVAGGLPPGAYPLRWEAKAMRGGPVLDGRVPFTVR